MAGWHTVSSLMWFQFTFRNLLNCTWVGPPKITYLLLLSEADEVVGDSTGHEL